MPQLPVKGIPLVTGRPLVSEPLAHPWQPPAMFSAGSYAEVIGIPMAGIGVSPVPEGQQGSQQSVGQQSTFPEEASPR
ncbi:MAG: hypothetical protein ACT4QC_22675 [Planctomycetaceae bacterium]